MTNPSIAVVIASTRPERHGPLIGQLLDEPRPAQSRAYTHDHTRTWSQTIDGTDGFIMVLPEHNRSMPASVKNALDCLYWDGSTSQWGSCPTPAASREASEPSR